MKSVLLTGFEPFDRETVNPSIEAVLAVEAAGICGVRLVTAELPCAFDTSAEQMRRLLEQHRPDLIVAVGQAGGRTELTLERVAINLDDARIPDNAGAQPIDRPVVAGGPAAYFSSLPLKATVQALRKGGIPASVSYTAGTFVCNHLFYALMHEVATLQRVCRAGFVHVPYLPAQAAAHPGQPSMALATMVEGLRLVVSTALSVAQDTRESAGQLH
ncbi:pyroglutamyl-peptidase I [Caldimonas brevitalea]|uniref:Pyrrolidone-carboxylate peptidase n=1 Tax=Caldimonas brevitalea TaxID=413882 RepID=A0A0G3BJ76_9BURK|nr:pyroglutamyl-peptidase I [Caldimonas brevitalea]AKJ29504.1 pyroglutamyl-peptidase [Caldimonas brevitalea]